MEYLVKVIGFNGEAIIYKATLGGNKASGFSLTVKGYIFRFSFPFTLTSFNSFIKGVLKALKISLYLLAV